jgi:hypothetical protein
VSFYRNLLLLGFFGSAILALLPFLKLPVIPTNTEFIASYGAYLAGTIGPFISAMAFIALLQTIRLQQKQVELQNIDAKKRDMLRVLDKSEMDLEECLAKHKLTFTFQDVQYSYKDMLTLPFFEPFFKNNLPSKSDQATDSEEVDWKQIMGTELMQSADLQIIRLAIAVKNYDSLCEENPMYDYFQAKYLDLIKRLNVLGYLHVENQKYWCKKA